MTAPVYQPAKPTIRQDVLDHDPSARSSWVSIGIFVVVAYGLAWLACLPLWLGDGLGSKWFLLCGGLMMYAPAVAAIVAAKGVERQPKVLLNLGIWPVPSWKRLISSSVIVFVVLIVVQVAALGVSALVGTYRFDLVHFAGYTEVLNQSLEPQGKTISDLGLPIWGVLLANLAALPVNALFSMLLAFGEEVGWRGFLQPRLQSRLGAGGSVLAVAAIWGVWHAPLLLLGYNYPTLSWPLRLLWMSAFSVIGSAILAWVRQRSRSVWPAAYGHGVINRSLGLVALGPSASPTFDTANSTLMGWPGWPIAVVVVVVLVVTGALKPWRGQAPKPAPNLAQGHDGR